MNDYDYGSANMVALALLSCILGGCLAGGVAAIIWAVTQ